MQFNDPFRRQYVAAHTQAAPPFRPGRHGPTPEAVPQNRPEQREQTRDTAPMKPLKLSLSQAIARARALYPQLKNLVLEGDISRCPDDPGNRRAWGELNVSSVVVAGDNNAIRKQLVMEVIKLLASSGNQTIYWRYPADRDLSIPSGSRGTRIRFQVTLNLAIPGLQADIRGVLEPSRRRQNPHAATSQRRLPSKNTAPTSNLAARRAPHLPRETRQLPERPGAAGETLAGPGTKILAGRPTLPTERIQGTLGRQQQPQGISYVIVPRSPADFNARLAPNLVDRSVYLANREFAKVPGLKVGDQVTFKLGWNARDGVLTATFVKLDRSAG